ncbi:MAG TPA: O-antigen ligase family protein [Nitrospirales bacterium]|nr:O-antigen ligase family protein [Nitrospirales bacterium]HIA14889.1 O-antigen ligase family protein [Nitrospirales bacterium]HIB53853.1 O-antigen ligase family protein [Nitrospirales bacterium]HIC04436.1 O-antigen ligase family protein [Nitrospirales bacterium]HIN32943.1 O-antigen ligase family protein [Nitrospirales bacterium]
MNSRVIDTGIEWSLMGVAAAILVADLNHLLEYTFIALAIVVLTRQIASRDRRLARTSLDVPILVFLGWVLISIVSATDPTYSFAEWLKLLAHVLMFFLAANFISEEGQVKRILGAFVVGVLLMSIYGIVEFFVADGSLVDQWYERTLRADSLTSEYNWFSTYLMMALPIVAVWALSTDHREWRIVLVVTLVVATFALFLTYTRAAWIAVAVQACLLVALKGSNVMKLVVAGMVVVALSTVIVVTMQDVPKGASGERGVEGHTANLSTLLCRLHIWELGVKDMSEHPITGLGYGTKTFARKYHDIHVSQCPPQLHNIHNSYMSFAFGAGIPALCFFVWIFWRILHTFWIGLVQGPSYFQRMFALGLLLMTVGLMIRITFDVMFLGMLAVLFWMLVGLFFGLQRTLIPTDLPSSRVT